jgi:hypothetical protein
VIVHYQNAKSHLYERCRVQYDHGSDTGSPSGAPSGFTVSDARRVWMWGSVGTYTETQALNASNRLGAPITLAKADNT